MYPPIWYDQKTNFSDSLVTLARKNVINRDRYVTTSESRRNICARGFLQDGGGSVSSSVRVINYAGASWPASSAGK